MSNKINRLHERALRIAYKDFCSSFATLLEKDRSVTIHEKNLQLLMTEIFKTMNNQSPTFMNEIFPQRNAYNLRNSNTFTVPIVHTVKYGTETVRYRGKRIWHTLPQEIKDANSVQQFKNRIKFWKYTYFQNFILFLTVTVDSANNTYLSSVFIVLHLL